MASVRIQRVSELLKRQLSELIRREFPNTQTGILITVNEVQVAKDLQSATVYVGMVGSDAQRKKGIQLLQDERKRLQSLVARAVVLKYTPVLRFVLDDSVSRGNRVLEILDEIERSEPPHDGPSEDH